MTRVEIDFDPDFRAHTCHGCGTAFAVPAGLYDRFQRRGASLRCPNPSCPWPSFSITETEADKLRKQLEAERERARRAHEAREWAEKQLTAQKGQNTKLRKRIANGVCPCCHRSFQNVKRHVAMKHPDYAEASKP